MKAAVLLLIATVNATSTSTSYFRFVRPVVNTPQSQAQTCLVLDAQTFAHAAPGLADLRLFDGATEVPFVIRTAAAVQAAQAALLPLNLGTRNGRVSFDLAMPQTTYSDLELDVSAQNFIATVSVSGSDARVSGAAGRSDAPATKLGAFTIFDLTAQKLGRSTVLHLPASTFRNLHLEIAGPLKPEQIHSASVAPESATQSPYTAVAETSTVQQRGRSSVVEFTVPANVPVDRVSFAVASQPANFTRGVTVTLKPTSARAVEDGTELPVSFSGNLLRLHRVEDGQKIDEEQLTVDTRNELLNQPSKWTVSLDNGDDPPLALHTVRLEMQQRELCFDTRSAGSYSLFYGDNSLHTPRYDYATLFTPQSNPAQSTAAAEQRNPNYQPRPDERPFTERHPALLWIALVAVLLVLGGVAIRSVSSTRP